MTGGILPVILCGGGGERLWPLSRAAMPKHLLRLAGGPSLLQRTLERLEALPGPALPPLVLCNESDRFLVQEQAGAVAGDILVEPIRRDSAAAVALAVAAAAATHPGALLLVLAADHLITDREAFGRSVAAAVPLAEAGEIVTFGIVPDRPSSAFGYIRAGTALAGATGARVEAFVEKPDPGAAAAMLAEGGWYWNAGIFLFAADTMAAALQQHFPHGRQAAEAAWEGRWRDCGMLRFAASAFGAAPRLSIDYAVMEKVANLAVVPAAFDWADIGQWPALAALLQQDDAGNATEGRVSLSESRGSIVYSDADMLVAGIGLDGMLVAVTPDALLVSPKDRLGELKALVARLRAEGFAEADQHRAVYRPWGRYEPLAGGDRYLVKRIVIRPGGILSLQRHNHRAEHWVVVRGTARVTIGGDVRLVGENQSVYVPTGTVHRLENPGPEALEIIEVQTGALLSEDDIERLSDAYGRT